MALERVGKILFLGLAESGKTTIIKTLMEGNVPENLGQYTATLNYERKNITHLDKKITMFDLGGQINFLDRYTGELAKFIFSKTNALIFVIDTSNVGELTRVKYYLDLAVDKVHRHSPDTPVYILLHKVDLLNPHMQDELCNNLKVYLKSDLVHPLTFYKTSVLDKSGETIFNAFNTILGVVAGEGEVVSLEAEGPVTPTSIVESFAKENSKTLIMAQLLDNRGVPIIKGSRDFTHITKFDARRALDNALQYIANSIEVTNSTLFESDDNLYFIRFLSNGNILVLNFSKEAISLKGENIPSVYDKVMVIVKKLEENS
ncbi:MAG: ADP-ribosylation factor-like protein [Candidatus Hodarchaeales archaeon]